MDQHLKMTAVFAAMGLSLGGCMTNANPMSPMADAIVTVGGAPMYPTKNIIENAVNSADHTTLVAAVKAGSLAKAALVGAKTVNGPGPDSVSTRPAALTAATRVV